MAGKVRVIDTTKCIGCRSCQVACKNWNQLPATETAFAGSYENPSDLSSETWSRVRFNEHADNGEVKWYFSFYSCMHCSEPACINVCQFDALSKSGTGPVIVDRELCKGCGACAAVCPFQVPRTGGGKMWKCTFCTDRIGNGLETACAKACPTGTISFGDADEKIAEAEARVSLLQERGYANAQIYGKEELGGLSVIYILADTPDKYGLPVNPEVSLATTYLWKVALAPVKALATVGLAAGTLSSWLRLRKEKVAQEKEAEKEMAKTKGR
ncbi:MAG: 4Fe-4S dicluster domain-containing protein [Dethiobacteria bacterium]|jgi:formate dehydrogenase iron-sulfur subunit